MPVRTEWEHLDMGQYTAELIHYVIQDIADVGKYFFAGLAAFLTVGTMGLLAAEMREKKGRPRGFFLAAAVFAGYLCMLLFITFLSREPGSRDGIDWIPFGTLGSGPRGDAFVLENVLLFLPFGVLLPSVSIKMRRFWKVLGMGCASSLLIEFCQYFTRRGYAQLDDVLTNVLGTALGYIFYIIFRRWIKKW